MSRRAGGQQGDGRVGVRALAGVEDRDVLEYLLRGCVGGLGELQEESDGQPFHAGDGLDRGG
ncbi:MULTISPECIES: hypothetical protein [Parafrankia]|uniref:hypothetical protein n=1 Tax=Parafrankia TaxID=2994362 RepID=UPI001D028E69|nr:MULTISPECIES: hypothetical protein [Parafrankia]